MRVTLYGGFAEKGRTCVGVESGGCRLLLDAGIKTSARGTADYYPAITDDALRAIDALIVTHAHEDHVGALGWCLAHGLRGRIYMTDETRRESAICLADYAEPAHRSLALAAPVASLRVGDGALQLAGLRIGTGRSGHVAGGVWCAIDDGMTRIVYCGDIAPSSPVFAMDAVPRCAALVIDASYGDDTTGAAARASEIAAWIAARPQGCVLATPLYGRSAELLAIVPGRIALAPGMRDALLAQIACAQWLVAGIAETLIARLEAAEDWRAGAPLPQAALLCHDGMGISGSSPAILAQACAQSHPALFTGHLPGGSPGERMVAEGRAAWIRLPTHPTLPENAAVVASSAPGVVIGHSCEPSALEALAQHLPRVRAKLATGDSLDV